MGPSVWIYVVELFKNPVFDTGLIFWFILRCFKVYPELTEKFFPTELVKTLNKTNKKRKQVRRQQTNKRR